MYDSIFSKDIISKAKTYLKEKKVKNIIFSFRTYQVEVSDDGKVQWTFIQLNSKNEFSDLFCECGGSKTSPCVHLAASVEAIYRNHTEPLHIRYEQCLWKRLLEVSAERLGYDQDVLKKEGNSYVFPSNSNGCKLEITPKTDRAKEHFKITVDEREEETEETSIKFSNLEPEELENWKNGRPSKKLRFELSFWADLAKYLLFVEDDERKADIHLIERDKKLPSGLEINLKDFTIKISIEENRWESLAFSLRGYKTNLLVHEMSGREIEKIIYKQDSATFSIIGKNASSSSMDNNTIDLGEWKFIPKKGFFPSFDDPLLSGKEIVSNNIEEALDKYKEKFSTWLENEVIHIEEKKVQFDLQFDNENNLHIVMYVFEKEDLNTPNARLFGKWAYLPGKGFYLLTGLLFTGIERMIKNELLGEFIDRHKSFLTQFEGFTIHLTNIESSVRYRFENEVLEILGDELHDEESGVIDCGKYLYVKGQGFFIQGDGRLDKHIFPGMRIEKEELSHFITVNKEELETVTNFFIQDEGLDKTGLDGYIY